MRQWTDVDFTVTVKGADLTGASGLFATVVQDGEERIFTDNVDAVGTNAVAGHLMPEETGKLQCGRPAVMYINWLTAAGRKAATEIPIRVEPNYPRRPLPLNAE